MQSKILGVKTLLLLSTFIFSLNACQNSTKETNSEENITGTTITDSTELRETENFETASEENLATNTISEETMAENEKNAQPASQNTQNNKVAKKNTKTQQSTQTPTADADKKKPTLTKPSTTESQTTVKKKNTTPSPKTTSTKTEQPKVRKPKPVLSHKIWDDLLRKHVSATGKVNYAGFKKDKTKLNQYLQLLSDNPPAAGWSRNKQIAYWINAYNAFTVDLIVDNYPISSILKLDDGKTWYVKRITIGGKKYSLNDIEKNILIGKFKEERVHFAINCAAKSCPPLKNRAWSANSLNADLDKATKAFINNTSFNQIKKKSATLSQIFNWYKADFGDVVAYINKYSTVQLSAKAKLSYNEYDWDLNK